MSQSSEKITENTMSPADVLALELARANAEWAGYPMGESVALHEIERPDLYVAMARRVIEREAALLAEVRQWKANESEVRRTADMHAKRIARITEKSKNREAALVAERNALAERVKALEDAMKEINRSANLGVRYGEDGAGYYEEIKEIIARAEGRNV